MNAFSDVFDNADQVIFSTRITLDNALEQYGIARGTAMHILPQGKCIVPSAGGEAAERVWERKWLDETLRPNGKDDREFLVLGGARLSLARRWTCSSNARPA